MAQGIRPGEKPLGAAEYADIIDLPRWEPNSKHPRMSLHDRAAQFAPFAALTGYDEMVDEEARQTETRVELSEEQAEIISRRLCIISDALSAGQHPWITFTYFVPDGKKAGGRYTTVYARPRRIDRAQRRICLMDAGKDNIPEYIQIDCLLSVSGSVIECMENPEVADWPY